MTAVTGTKPHPIFLAGRWVESPDVLTVHNPADASTYQEPVHISRSRYTVTGQTPGATLNIRVQALDSKLPTGKSEWSAWVPIIVGV